MEIVKFEDYTDGITADCYDASLRVLIGIWRQTGVAMASYQISHKM